ncbi:MAG: hypothetical protein ABFR89_08425 [Actinomycetota bacterium]
MHAFVDESIRRRYVLSAVTVAPRDLDSTRTELRAMLLPGQRRLHFVSESASRRKRLLSQISRMRITANVYVCTGKDVVARKAGMR